MYVDKILAVHIVDGRLSSAGDVDLLVQIRNDVDIFETSRYK